MSFLDVGAAHSGGGGSNELHPGGSPAPSAAGSDASVFIEAAGSTSHNNGRGRLTNAMLYLLHCICY